MVRSTEHLEILNEVARIATSDLELRPMLQRITDALQQAFDWEFVACVSIDWVRERFVCEAVSSRMPSQIHVGYSRGLGSGVVGEVALTGRALELDDARDYPNFIDTLPGSAAELCVPVRHQGETVAVLNLESPRVGAFRGQLPLLETVAEQVAGAIANAHLHAELTRRARLLEMVSEVSKVATDAGELDLLLDHVVRYVHYRFPLTGAAIMLADMEAGEITQIAHSGAEYLTAERGDHWPISRGVVGRALRSGEPQMVTDVTLDADYVRVDPRTVAEYAVPIRFRERLLGVLNIESDQVEVFSRENQTVFRTFADQLAGAIHMASINRELEEANELLREANQRLERLSQLDGLTGIANRRSFDYAVAVEWRRAARAEAPLAVVMIDIDCFKDYNDHYGHQKGDHCLRRVARCLREGLNRAGDFVARYGGEEFAVLVPGQDTEHAAALAESLRARVEALGLPHARSSAADFVTISAGVASVRPSRAESSEPLIHAADAALYDAKRAGRNRVAVAVSVESR